MTALLLVLLIGNFLLDTVAELLNLKTLSQGLPQEFEGIYDQERYTQSLRYQAEGVRFDLVRRTVALGALLGFWFSGGFNAVDQFARGLAAGPILRGLIFMALLSVLQRLLSLPFSIYDTFVIEERYGFNRTTPQTFVLDMVKGLLLSVALGAPILAAILYFFETAGSLAWLYSWVALTVIQLALSFVAPVWILPLFNRFEPLPEGELRRAIEAYATKEQFQLSGIFTMDSSKRSAKSNAFFTGFGRYRRLVLFDTLIAKQSVEELTAVVAHEIGHYKRRHILKSIALSIAVSGVLFYALSLLIKNEALFAAFRMDELSVYASLVFASILFSPALRLLSFPTNALSRKFEYEADEFAVRTTGARETLVSALKKLSVDNLSHLTPHPFKVMLDYTHPPILRRIEALRKTG